jgi:hypothetical protein
MAPADIREIVVEVPDLGEVRGTIVSWNGGELVLQTEGGNVVIAPDGTVSEQGAGGPIEDLTETDRTTETRPLKGATM